MSMMHQGARIADSGEWVSMVDMMNEMTLSQKTGFMGTFLSIHWFLSLLAWVSVIVVLIALARLLWKKGDKIK